MAKVEALEWGSFMSGEIKPKFTKLDKKVLKKLGTIAAVVAVESILIHAVPVLAGSEKSITTMAMAPDFQGQLANATAPIHKLINGFAHEIYGVFMAWGAIEAMIGKTQQGFTRMKVATLGYVLLFWVPWIVDTVNGVRPGG